VVVIKLLNYEAALKSFDIAPSNDLRIHALCINISIGVGNSINGAIEVPTSKQSYGLSNNAIDWQQLTPTFPIPTYMAQDV
jgi:hypothetical protein